MARVSKGSAFERSFCTQLSLWWSGGKDDGIFWRTASSGGRAKRRGRADKRTAGQHGDICAIDPVGKPFIDVFTLELKRGYNRSTIADVLDAPRRAASQVYEKWFDQAKESCEQAGSYSWAVVHKRDMRESLIILPGKIACELYLELIAEATVKINGVPVYVLPLSAFFAHYASRIFFTTAIKSHLSTSLIFPASVKASSAMPSASSRESAS